MKFAISMFFIAIGMALVMWSHDQKQETTIATQTEVTTQEHSSSTHSYKKLYRSKNNRMIAGVCGGLGAYLDVDPTIIRLVAAAGALTGVGIVLYLAAWIIIPLEPTDTSHK